jgi:hypothetical protein
MKAACLAVAVLFSCDAWAQMDLKVTPGKVTLAPGQSITFEAKRGNTAVMPTVTSTPASVGSWTPSVSAAGVLTAPTSMPAGVEHARVELAFVEGGQTVNVQVDLVSDNDPDWEARAVVGYHQAGASGADFTQNFFLDFFIMRGLGNQSKVYDSRVNLWGNARIASVPQQLTIPVSQFVTQFAQQAGNVKVNELAQSVGFETGLEFRVKNFGQGQRIRMLGAIGSIGAQGTFDTPLQQVRVYERPGADTPQRAEFDRRFPGVTTDYVALAPPQRERFFRQWWIGGRLTSFNLNAPYAAPATYAVTFGQDESITGGQWDGMVGRVDVFYPLPIGKEDGRFRFLYLFGTGNFRLAKANDSTPLFLKDVTPADHNAPAEGKVPVFDPRVTVVTVPATRDTYRIGAGIDLVHMIRAWAAN